MKFASQGFAVLSKRVSLLAVAGVAVLAFRPELWVASRLPPEPKAMANSAEPARLLPDTGPTVERVAFASKRAIDARNAAKPEAESKRALKEQAAPAPAQEPLPPPQPSSQAVPVPPPPEPAPPPPNVWSDAEIIEALKECVRLLAPIAAEIEVAEPLKKGECGAPAPVALKSIGGIDKVEFRPAVPLNCRMVVALHKWVEKSLQPAARELLGSPVTRISSGTYSCRNRYGLVNGKISEHAFANAIDIASFGTADGRTVNVLRHWGPTARHIEAQRIAAAAAKAKAAVPQPVVPRAKAVVLPKDPEGRVLPQQVADHAETQYELRTAQMKLGAKATAPVAKMKAAAAAPPGPSPEEEFLHRLHRGACGVFGTVLGPEADEAHSNHFHLDLAQRRSKRSYCR
jgi:hypothetical protein